MKKVWSLMAVVGTVGVLFALVSPATSGDRSGSERERSGRSLVQRRSSESLKRTVVREGRPTTWRSETRLAAPRAAFDPDAPEVDVNFEASLAPMGGGDLDPTIDVQITQEIIDLAAELGSVQATYEFVRNELEFLPYYGSRKGSVETLRQRSGNDYDVASLLIALLRASGTPARYAEGIVEMDAATAASWLAVDDPEVAGSILFTKGMEGINIVDSGGLTDCCTDNGTPGCDDPTIEACVCALDTFCCNVTWDQQCAGEVVSFGCGECDPIVVAVRARRIWVEAFTSHGFGGPTWVPLDPAFKLTQIHPGIDIPEEMGLDARTFMQEYYDPAAPGVTLPRLETPIDILKQDISAYLAINYPGLTVADVKRSHTIAPEGLGILPSSLPYAVRSRDGSFSEIPADRRYQVQFHLYDGATTLIDHTVNLPEVASKRITLSYEGATPGDQATIDAHNGLLYTPPSLINIRPLLKVAGQTVATGAASIGAGRTHNSDIHFLAPMNSGGLPQNVVPSISNTIVAGELQAIGLAVNGTSNPFFAPEDPSDTEGFIAQQRHATAMDYLERGLATDEEYGALMHARTFGDVGDAILKDDIIVTTDGGGNPIAWQWGGLTVDADRLILGAWKVDEFQTGCGGEATELLILGGAQGSLHESLIFEDNYTQEAVSTIKILQLAVGQGITVYHRWNSLPLPPNTLPASTASAIQNAIAGGNEVTFPADPIMYFNWFGTGYINMDPCNGAAGYIIAGGLNGGSTVDSWTDILWTDPNCTVKCVQGRVTKPAMDSPDENALFITEDTAPLMFEYDLRVEYMTDEDCLNQFGVWTSRSHTSKSPKQLAPDNYNLIVGDKGEPGDDQHIRKLTLFEIKLHRVSYDNNHTVKKDDGSEVYTAPHWQDGNLDGTANAAAGEKNHPVAFTRNTTMSAESKFKVKPTPPGGVTFKVKATGQNGLDFPEKTATVSGDTITYPKTASSGMFMNMVQKGQPLITKWEVSVDGGSKYFESGTSDNLCYVTLGDPVNTPVFHTVMHLGCENGHGNTAAGATTTAIWGEFTDRDVRRFDGTQLTYYANWGCVVTDVAGLLSTTDGQCYTWAQLFLDVLKGQGIDQGGDYVNIRGPAGVAGFLVKDWTFAAGGGTSGVAGFPYMNIPETPYVVGNSYAFKFEEVSDQIGIAGQGTADPASLFSNHQIAKIGGTYYDPSYGVTYSSLADMDSSAIDGYVKLASVLLNEPDVGADLNGDGDMTDMGVMTVIFAIKQNPAGTDLVETITNY